MQQRIGVFDVWVYRRDADAVRYLLMHTSQEKADRWFNGGRFWQIPSDCVEGMQPKGFRLSTMWQRSLFE